MSQTALILGHEALSLLAHTTARMASYAHTHVFLTLTHRRHALPLHTCQAQPHQSTALLRIGKEHHLVTQVASGSSLHSAPPNACRAPPHDSTPTASFDVCLLDLLWPQPPLTSSLHQGSTLGPLISVVAACVKDARPSRWLAPLERPRWPQHRPRVAPPAKPSRLAVESVELVGPAKRFGSCMARAEAWALQRGAECSARGWNARSALKTPKTRTPSW